MKITAFIANLILVIIFVILASISSFFELSDNLTGFCIIAACVFMALLPMCSRKIES